MAIDPELLELEALALAEAALRPPDIAGLHHAAIEDTVGRQLKKGGRAFLALARRAVARKLEAPAVHRGPGLFTPDELLLLAELLGDALKAGQNLAHLLLLDQMHGAARRELGVKESRLLEAAGPIPQAALDFFRGLLPLLGTDPQRSGPALARRAFTLAVATSEELLKKVQDAIAGRIESGQVTRGERAVQAILDDAGVSSRNPQYAATVLRTNVMDSYGQAYQDQLSRSTKTFPVWKMTNPADSRSRPSHAARNGNYYPSNVSFSSVRGTGPEDVINCRCVQVAIFFRDWQSLKAKGARLADGYDEIEPAPEIAVRR